MFIYPRTRLCNSFYKYKFYIYIIATGYVAADDQKPKNGDKPKSKDTRSNDEREGFVFSLAIILIGGFLFFYGIVLFNAPTNTTTGETNYSGLDKVASSLGGIVAAVVGYYFGQRPVAAFAKQAADAKDETRSVKKKAAETLGDADDAKAKVQEMSKELESIKKLLGE